jgi:hypothetical protein
MWKGIPVLCFHQQTHLRPLVLNSVQKQYEFVAGDINCSPHQEEVGKYIHRGRLLGSNTSLFGPGLAADEYQLYFLVDFPLCVRMCVCMLVALHTSLKFFMEVVAKFDGKFTSIYIPYLLKLNIWLHLAKGSGDVNLILSLSDSCTML